MDVFIGWSGKHSHEIAKEFHNWLPKVIQAVKPFISSEDIKKGTNWSSEISTQLDNSNFGISILTSDNYKEPWVNFEAGALSKKFGNSHLCPILFDIIKTDLKGPLSQFQLTSFNNEDILKLMKSINETQDEPLDDRTLEDTYEVWWPRLKSKIDPIIKAIEDEGQETTAEIEENKPDEAKYLNMLDEILYLMKKHSEKIDDINRNTMNKKDVVEYIEKRVSNIPYHVDSHLYNIESLIDENKKNVQPIKTDVTIIMTIPESLNEEEMHFQLGKIVDRYPFLDNVKVSRKQMKNRERKVTFTFNDYNKLLYNALINKLKRKSFIIQD